MWWVEATLRDRIPVKQPIPCQMYAQMFLCIREVMAEVARQGQEGSQIRGQRCHIPVSRGEKIRLIQMWTPETLEDTQAPREGLMLVIPPTREEETWNI